ncbi:basic helix-loop-helix DNA-binding superfamily protein [Perilla frutescens var. frutescens]|nr:basic helix-loop-helix DNA-binding superfamily protein [Perilla frutescens var. frutescens]
MIKLDSFIIDAKRGAAVSIILQFFFRYEKKPSNHFVRFRYIKKAAAEAAANTMTSSLLSANPAVSSDRSATRRRRKKKIQSHAVAENLSSSNDRQQQQDSSIEWKSDAQQQIYSSKLLQALRQVRLSDGSPAPKRVHEAADRVLAATAKGRTRWSRAILTNRLKLKFMKKNNIVKRQNKVMSVIAATGNSRSPKKSKVKILRLKSKSLPAVQRKVRVLSRLVPGCRKQPMPVVLEEATDYIAALEMQVKAMSALAELLSVSGSSTSATAQLGRGVGTDQLGSSSSSSSSRTPPS